MIEDALWVVGRTLQQLSCGNCRRFKVVQRSIEITALVLYLTYQKQHAGPPPERIGVKGFGVLLPIVIQRSLSQRIHRRQAPHRFERLP